MWAGRTDGSDELAWNTVLQEIRRLLREHSSYDVMDLLAATQSLVLLLIIILFDTKHSSALEHPADAQLLIDAWDMKHSLAEWAWSLLHGYPILTCFELGPLPAPAAGYLWQETKEDQWHARYRLWIRQWQSGSYKMAEFFHIDPSGELDARTEMWLAEVDDFGMMLMAEDGKEIDVHWDDYSSLLIAKPLKFQFDTLLRHEKKKGLVQAMFEAAKDEEDHGLLATIWKDGTVDAASGCDIVVTAREISPDSSQRTRQA
ncbi:uncharacterized protein E0L32_008632 [Thyridium curvatum]|uniref:Uncharacterized protein n=1 Tax=Thyridium curvatum TaxID=1093900 RepID=A0A507ARI0_9PEZI|nr:uncharacterized protein E0L32_008632 [Thyridium curvatum]TPX10413.1 hypothetical protein E0L32_008632 [Thyridium curvatum]